MYMIYAKNHSDEIVQVLSWTKSKEEGINYMNVLLRERKKSASKIWAEKINQPETF